MTGSRGQRDGRLDSADYPVKAETLRNLAVTALKAAAPLIAEAERDRIRRAALAEAAGYHDFGCAALVRRALQRFAGRLEDGR